MTVVHEDPEFVALLTQISAETGIVLPSEPVDDAEQFGYEAHHIRLSFFIKTTVEEGGHADWAQAIDCQKVSAKDGNGLLGGLGVEQRGKGLGNVRGAETKIPQDIKEIVSVLIVASVIEGQRFKHDERTRAAHPNVPCGLLAEDGRAGQLNFLAIAKGKWDAWGDQRGKISLNIENAAWSR